MLTKIGAIAESMTWVSRLSDSSHSLGLLLRILIDSFGPSHPLTAWRSRSFRWKLMSGANTVSVDFYKQGDRPHFKFMAI
ncbi:hypothetical protein [Laspinema olomoucense]|uniref:Uncharacterized protein n=1 Tax=Laspinema olomoucense D3b TaxID=2953688 RepID=A0ABT2N0T6_9CYAN|nr:MULTISPECIES: hypothetical protein [unclassified Laspinema]MCT7976288.1 hypothetical protein [Laspinema sp. D3b]MCT7993838.1 hypothetical protein [Laspinema sp. D3c]